MQAREPAIPRNSRRFSQRQNAVRVPCTFKARRCLPLPSRQASEVGDVFSLASPGHTAGDQWRPPRNAWRISREKVTAVRNRPSFRLPQIALPAVWPRQGCRAVMTAETFEVGHLKLARLAAR
jgi:hypothetical protein